MCGEEVFFMQKNNIKKRKNMPFGKLEYLAVAALLTALSIICGKFLAFPVGNVLRFSFENLPVIFAGIILGPVTGAAVGITADLIGCIMVGYTINPIITVGMAAIGFLSGLIYKYTSKLTLILRISLSAISAHTIGSVIIKTFGLAKFYSMPFITLLLWRFINYVIICTAEIIILYFLLKNKGISNVIKKLKQKG